MCLCQISLTPTVHKYLDICTSSFNTLCNIKSISAWSLQPVDISWCFVCFLVMFSQAFTAANLSSCLLACCGVCLPLVRSLASAMRLNQIENRWLTWPVEHVPLSALKSSLVALALCLRLLSCWIMKCLHTYVCAPLHSPCSLCWMQWNHQ